MAINTYGIYLMYSTSELTETATYARLVDIKSFPALGGAPELLETTTLSDKNQTNINGIQSLDALEFECNYDAAKFAELKKMENVTKRYAVYFGEDGKNGVFEFSGQLSVYPNEGGVNEVVGMTVSIACSTEIVFKEKK